MALGHSFDKIVKGAISDLYDIGKVKFEEAVLPFVVFPSERETYETFPETFKTFLMGKKLFSTCAAEHFRHHFLRSRPTLLQRISDATRHS